MRNMLYQKNRRNICGYIQVDNKEQKFNCNFFIFVG